MRKSFVFLFFLLSISKIAQERNVQLGLTNAYIQGKERPMLSFGFERNYFSPNLFTGLLIETTSTHNGDTYGIDVDNPLFSYTALLLKNSFRVFLGNETEHHFNFEFNPGFLLSGISDRDLLDCEGDPIRIYDSTSPLFQFGLSFNYLLRDFDDGNKLFLYTKLGYNQNFNNQDMGGASVNSDWMFSLGIKFNFFDF